MLILCSVILLAENTLPPRPVEGCRHIAWRLVVPAEAARAAQVRPRVQVLELLRRAPDGPARVASGLGEEPLDVVPRPTLSWLAGAPRSMYRCRNACEAATPLWCFTVVSRRFMRSYVMTLMKSTALVMRGMVDGVKAIRSSSLPGVATVSSLSVPRAERSASTRSTKASISHSRSGLGTCL